MNRPGKLTPYVPDFIKFDCLVNRMVQLREISLTLLTAAILTAGPAKPVYAQPAETGILPVYNFTPKEYKALEQNWCATEDNRGVLYFGNNAGILEYDGAHWTLIPPTDGSPVHSIARSSEGRIFLDRSMHSVTWLPIRSDSLSIFFSPIS